MSFISNCADCPYGGPAIGARGNPASRIVLVGEAPGATEIAVGEPFRGPAGELLGDALVAAGLREPTLFIINAVACLPDPVRPRIGALSSCRARLAADLGAHPRSIIVALGATAIRAVTGVRGYRVTQKPSDAELPSNWGNVIPTLHPAFVRRRGRNGLEYRTLVADLRRAQVDAAALGVRFACGS